MSDETESAGTAPQARPATRRLATRMLLALGAGLLAMLAAELAIRNWLELPELYRIEQESDARGVERLRNAVTRRIDELGNSVRDYAAWDTAYAFMAAKPGDATIAYFLESEIGPATYRNNQINGIMIFDPEGRVVHSGNVDLATGVPSPAFELRAESLDPRIFRRPPSHPVHPVIAAGIARSNLGYVLFASALIVDTRETQPPRGTMLFWRLVDKTELGEIARLTGQVFSFIPVSEITPGTELAPVLAQLMTPELQFTPRDDSGALFWLQNDFAGNPAFLVQSQANPRSFDARLISTSAVVGFVASGLVLMLFTVMFTRMVVDRVARASTIMRNIRETGAFHHRIPVDDGTPDELGEMFQHFNALLVRVGRQEEDLREQNRRLAEMSQQDTLTGIPNRRALNENFDRFWRQAVRAKRPISVLMVDVDYFKPYNDRYGHLSGDRVLKQVAQALQENLHRATDFVARYGGEEFCVVLTETTLQHAIRVAEGLRKAIMDIGIRHEDSPHARAVTISIGVASAMADQTVVHLDLMRAADRALYRAKDLGRNRVVHIEEDSTEPGSRSSQKADPDA